MERELCIRKVEAVDGIEIRVSVLVKQLLLNAHTLRGLRKHENLPGAHRLHFWMVALQISREKAQILDVKFVGVRNQQPAPYKIVGRPIWSEEQPGCCISKCLLSLLPHLRQAVGMFVLRLPLRRIQALCKDGVVGF